MVIGKVIGNVVATRKDDSLVGSKLLIVRPIDLTGQGAVRPYVAVDTVGAGNGDNVLIVEGSSARHVLGKPDGAVDAAIVGIIDSIEVDQEL
ncbi:EutN/CcmL family microcompartment protein [Sporolituus thermophilus]|uniref:Ethanolamine utilization protein EutN n=1 Tax=Sporolituus thermophilus DSM 23256 TaxID=1123285 RepID=A0A1G7M5N4_9FIRM|nr:EutN/CcmL family microcompartment protein [Sporolituus thermophilus]SDF56530.1 ethanolamine utilization protein EutN [Sporolituus thermophilus DSM 23256]